MLPAYVELFPTRVVGPPELTVVGRFTRVRYPFADRTIDVAIDGHHTLGMTVAAPCRELDGFFLRLTHNDRGTRDHLIGDADFQRTYTVHTSDMGLAIDLLDTATRSLIAFTGHATMPTRHRDRCYSYTIAQGFVSARSLAYDDKSEALEDAILAVDALSRRPAALATAWRRLAAELDAEVRGDTWTVAGDLRLVVASAHGAYTIAVGERVEDDHRRLATRVIDDSQAVIWIDAVVPEATRIRAAIAQLAAGHLREPYR